METVISLDERININIRPAASADLPALAGMAIAFRNHLQRSAPTDAQLADSITQLLAADDAEFCIAMATGRAIGYVLLRYRYSIWASGIEATIEDLFVDPAARDNGAGRKLIEFALGRADTRRCCSVCLDTNENNVASKRIYTGLGFSSWSSRWNGHQVFFRRNRHESM